MFYWLFVQHILRQQGELQALLESPYDSQGCHEGERCGRVGQERQTPGEHIRGKATEQRSTGRVGDKLSHLVLSENNTCSLCEELPAPGCYPRGCLRATGEPRCLGQGSPAGAPQWRAGEAGFQAQSSRNSHRTPHDWGHPSGWGRCRATGTTSCTF
ncbi:hypothetical protein HJG60_009364 [Phyllostomus discolor]|uniref:Uncharacterized protein n=1 Tax=Phyllostomus discolor TaxID=89673 RepID=A0A833YID6_9CHIR|nr:hypothetical protein HJG60_009364 [Phyllostomus discolor]